VNLVFAASIKKKGRIQDPPLPFVLIFDCPEITVVI
jgi:hypothetical protein